MDPTKVSITIMTLFVSYWKWKFWYVIHYNYVLTADQSQCKYFLTNAWKSCVGSVSSNSRIILWVLTICTILNAAFYNWNHLIKLKIKLNISAGLCGEHAHLTNLKKYCGDHEHQATCLLVHMVFLINPIPCMLTSVQPREVCSRLNLSGKNSCVL